MLIQPITDGPHETPTFVEKGIPFISAEAIVDNKINFSKKVFFFIVNFYFIKHGYIRTECMTLDNFLIA